MHCCRALNTFASAKLSCINLYFVINCVIELSLWEIKQDIMQWSVYIWVQKHG